MKRRAQEGIALLVAQLNGELAKQLAILLQEKHLYQKITIDAASLAWKVLSEVLDHEAEQFNRRVLQVNSFVLLSAVALGAAPRDAVTV